MKVFDISFNNLLTLDLNLNRMLIFSIYSISISFCVFFSLISFFLCVHAVPVHDAQDTSLLLFPTLHFDILVQSFKGGADGATLSLRYDVYLWYMHINM